MVNKKASEYLQCSFGLILVCIFQVFKEPIEQSFDQRGGPLLAVEEIKTIFGSLPEILDVHQRILVSWFSPCCCFDALRDSNRWYVYLLIAIFELIPYLKFRFFAEWYWFDYGELGRGQAHWKSHCGSRKPFNFYLEFCRSTVDFVFIDESLLVEFLHLRSQVTTPVCRPTLVLRTETN